MWIPGDPYGILLVPALVFVAWAYRELHAAYGRWSRVPSSSGMTGAALARVLLDRHGLRDVWVEEVQGTLSDHYDPRTRSVRLSPDVYHGTSLAALGVAAHEVGHAIQHAQSYLPLRVRHAIIPITLLGAQASTPLFALGMVLGLRPLTDLGLVLFLTVVAFQVITLPVELDASARALRLLQRHGLIGPSELPPVRAVLQAAALTYVATLAVALAELIRMLLLRSWRRRD